MASASTSNQDESKRVDQEEEEEEEDDPVDKAIKKTGMYVLKYHSPSLGRIDICCPSLIL